MRVVVSGGGTAGHISPTLATSDALKSLDKSVELLYIGQADSMEARIVAASGVRFAAIKAGKFRRYHSASNLAKLLNPETLGPNIRDAGRMVAGLGGALRVLRKYRPDVVFLKGGYVCLPVGLACRILRIPYVIHESDISPGLTNRILGRWAAKIAVAFPVRNYHSFEPGRLVYTGSPVRAEIGQTDRAAGLSKLGLDSERPVLFVTGGSSGAGQINDAIIKALPDLLPICQVVHLTGEREYERVKFELRHQGDMPGLERYHPYGFLSAEMPAALAAADIVIARAGANTIAELATLGKATVLIPNYEMAGHQVENARVLSRAGAARVLDGSKLTTPQLVGEVRRLLENAEERGRLEHAIRQFAKPDAAVELAQVILAIGRVGEPTEQEPNGESEA
jgi:UDP-N-acetylglucosamine--N-acetylmuramyl-(pentapeptide) pyrophosphoryl-undecaprenol N-acetylglucosamine transferase